MTENTEKLLPCPFCGSTPITHFGDGQRVGSDPLLCRCLNSKCVLLGKTFWISDWNRRAPAVVETQGETPECDRLELGTLGTGQRVVLKGGTPWTSEDIDEAVRRYNGFPDLERRLRASTPASDYDAATIKRYAASAGGCSCCGTFVDMEEDPAGDWVKYEDHAAAIRRHPPHSGRQDLDAYGEP